MPELPEVETIKNALSKAIGHSTILDVIINQNRLRQVIPSDFGKNIIGAKIVSIIVRALSAAVSAFGMFSTINVNSSPPMRATKSF